MLCGPISRILPLLWIIRALTGRSLVPLWQIDSYTPRAQLYRFYTLSVSKIIIYMLDFFGQLNKRVIQEEAVKFSNHLFMFLSYKFAFIFKASNFSHVVKVQNGRFIHPSKPHIRVWICKFPSKFNYKTLTYVYESIRFSLSSSSTPVWMYHFVSQILAN